MAEGQGIDFGASIPKFDKLRDEMRAYRDSNRENKNISLDQFRTDLLQIIQRTVPSMSFEEALQGLNEGVAAGKEVGGSSETLKKDIAWGALDNLVDDLERRSRELE